MPNKKAAIKYLRKSDKRATANALVKRNIKELIKSGQKAVKSGSDTAKLVIELQKAVDKAVKAKILKANTGDRKKSSFYGNVEKRQTAS